MDSVSLGIEKMDRLQKAIDTLHEVDREAGMKCRESRIHPVSRLFVSILYILVIVSFSKYDFMGLVSMSLYVLALSIVEELSLIKGLYRMRYVVGIVCLLGIVNPFFDRTVMFHIGGLAITGGVISMITLLVKGILTIYGAYFLAMMIGMNGIREALRALRVPKGAVTVVMLTYRYIIVLLKEVQRMNLAYHMRAPKQRGIHMRAWGSFVGLLLLRSMDRSQTVYDSMMLRGYRGEFVGQAGGSYRFGQSLLYVVFWMVIFISLRIFPVFELVGNLL